MDVMDGREVKVAAASPPRKRLRFCIRGSSVTDPSADVAAVSTTESRFLYVTERLARIVQPHQVNHNAFISNLFAFVFNGQPTRSSGVFEYQEYDPRLEQILEEWEETHEKHQHNTRSDQCLRMLASRERAYKIKVERHVRQFERDEAKSGEIISRLSLKTEALKAKNQELLERLKHDDRRENEQVIKSLTTRNQELRDTIQRAKVCEKELTARLEQATRADTTKAAIIERRESMSERRDLRLYAFQARLRAESNIEGQLAALVLECAQNYADASRESPPRLDLGILVADMRHKIAKAIRVVRTPQQPDASEEPSAALALGTAPDNDANAQLCVS